MANDPRQHPGNWQQGVPPRPYGPPAAGPSQPHQNQAWPQPPYGQHAPPTQPPRQAPPPNYMSAPPAPPNQPPRGGYGGNYGEQPNGPEKPNNKLKYAIGAGALAVVVGVGAFIGINQGGGEGNGNGSTSTGEVSQSKYEVLSNEQCLDIEESQGKKVYGGVIELAPGVDNPTDTDILSGFKVKDYDNGDAYSTWIDPNSLSDAQKGQLIKSARGLVELGQSLYPENTPRKIIRGSGVVVYGEVSKSEQIEDGKIDSEELGICMSNPNYR